MRSAAPVRRCGRRTPALGPEVRRPSPPTGNPGRRTPTPVRDHPGPPIPGRECRSRLFRVDRRSSLRGPRRAPRCAPTGARADGPTSTPDQRPPGRPHAVGPSRRDDVMSAATPRSRLPIRRTVKIRCRGSRRRRVRCSAVLARERHARSFRTCRTMTPLRVAAGRPRSDQLVSARG